MVRENREGTRLELSLNPTAEFGNASPPYPTKDLPDRDSLSTKWFTGIEVQSVMDCNETTSSFAVS